MEDGGFVPIARGGIAKPVGDSTNPLDAPVDSDNQLGASSMGLWLWLVIALILAAVASFFPARNASRLTVREVLAYE